MRTLFLGTVFVANTAIIGVILNSSVTTNQIFGVIADSGSATKEEASTASPASQRAANPLLPDEFAGSEVKATPPRLDTPGVKAAAMAGESSGALIAPQDNQLADNLLATARMAASEKRTVQKQEAAPAQTGINETSSAKGPLLSPLTVKAGDAQKQASDDLAALVQKLEGELELPAVPATESPTIEEASLTIVRKPQMTAFVTSFEGVTENGILSPENNYRITLSTDIPIGMISFATFPADGHAHRIDEFPGYCERVAYGQTQSGQEAVWLPAWSESGIENFDKFSEAITKPYLRTDLPETNEISRLGLWIVCTDQNLNDSRPFSSPGILKYMSGLELGKPTFIFPQ